MISPSVGRLAGNVTDVAGDVLTTGKEMASDAAKHLPEVTESVGKLARSSADVVADLATTALALTPFVHGSSRRRRRPWWLVPVFVLAVLAVFVAWKRSHSSAAAATGAAGSPGRTDSDTDRGSPDRT